jgi:hypothetical protein
MGEKNSPNFENGFIFLKKKNIIHFVNVETDPRLWVLILSMPPFFLFFWHKRSGGWGVVVLLLTKELPSRERRILCANFVPLNENHH